METRSSLRLEKRRPRNWKRVDSGAEKCYVRIIASETTGTPEELESLKLLERWLDTAVYRVPATMGDAYTSRSDGSLELEHERSDSWEHPVHHTSRFGLELRLSTSMLSCPYWRIHP